MALVHLHIRALTLIVQNINTLCQMYSLAKRKTISVVDGELKVTFILKQEAVLLLIRALISLAQNVKTVFVSQLYS